MVRRFFAVYFLFAALGLFSGCATAPVSDRVREAMRLDARESVVVTDCSRIAVIGADDDELRLIRDAFNGSPLVGGVPKAVQDSVKVIKIMRVYDPGHFPEHEPAHCHDDGTICVQAGYASWYMHRIVWHESGHAYEDWLDTAHFYGKYKAFERLVPENLYGEEKYPDEGGFPCKGIIRKHGSRNSHENWACFIEEVQACCNGHYSMLGSLMLGSRSDDPALYRAELCLA